MMAVE